MKLIKTFWLFLIFFLPFPAAANEAQVAENSGQAKILWEQAIAAKGGREQLHQVTNLVISYRETVRNLLGFVVHRGDVERLYVFPNKSWSWDDGLPPPFSLTTGWLDVEQNRRCILYAGSSSPVCGPAKQKGSPADEGITKVQYLYLMETRWVKPTPMSVTKDNIGLKRFDVLHTRFENKRVDYFLDRKTHLPARVAVFYNDSDRATLMFDFSNYVTVNGIQMPGRQEKGKINFQINAPYDESIFTRPPSIEAGPRAWQRAALP